MTHSFLFIMSLSGSVVLLLYILIYPIAKRYFSLAWSYRILKIAIVFYLIPFPICLSRLRVIVYEIFPQTVDNLYTSAYFINTNYVISIEGNSVYFSLKMKGMLILMLGFGILSSAIILLHIFQYRKIIKICLNHSYMPAEQEWQEIFYEIKNNLNIKRNVKLLCSEYCKSPITMGVIFPVIVIPLWSISETKKNFYQDVIKHELVHIKHRDLLIKLGGMLVIAVHWFNPLVYILYYEISNISEMYCDSIVLKGKGEKARKDYCELLLRLATKKQTDNSEFVVGIMGGNSKRAFERRLLEMKAVRKNKTVLSIVMMTLFCMAGGLTVCAYNVPAYTTSHKETDYQEQELDFQFTAGELKLETEELPYDHFFTDYTGNTYELNNEGNVSRASCSHKYVAGTFTSHNKKNSGGCTITYYEAKRCYACGYVKKGKEIQTVTYKICPH